MKKILLSGALAMSMLISSASAEQPAAQEYRDMFRAGEFYIEYADASKPKEIKFLAAFDNKRMERAHELTPAWVRACNPLGAMFGSRGTKYPTVLHKDGKYYQFLEDDRALELDENQLGEENLNPREGWNGVRRKLALPIELSVFYPNDPYSSLSQALETPKFVNSYQKSVGKKQYDCDRYAAEIVSLSGDETAQLLYDMLYDEGRLIEAQVSILRDGVEYPVNRIAIKKITGEIPAKAFKIGRKTTTYAAGKGDAHDLIEKRVPVGSMEGL